MKKFFIILFSMFSLLSSAQNDSLPKQRIATRVFTLSLGRQTMYNNYLSPLLYKGTDIRITDERSNFFKRFNNKVSYHNEFDFDFNTTHNPAKTNNIVAMNFRAFSGAHYHIRPMEKMTVLVGGLANGEVGLQYNKGCTGANNPVFPMLDANLWFSGICYYHIPVRSRVFTLREHFSMPFLGVTYAPNVNQLINDSEGCTHVTSFGSRLQWRNKLTIDLPVRTCTVRLGVLAERAVVKLNNLETRNMNISAVFGLTYNYLTFRGKNKTPDQYISSMQ